MNASSELLRYRSTLECYDEPLLREVASRLAKPRNQWPVAELIRKCIEVLENPPVLDRRLAELPENAQRLLALIARSRQSEWPLGSLFELLLAFGESAETVGGVVQDLFVAGFVQPVLPEGVRRFGSFGYWISTAAEQGPLGVFVPRCIASRATLPPTDFPDLAEADPLASPLTADGLEWLVRLGVLWQQALATPLRRTQGGGLFKRDVERLGQDPLLNLRSPEGLVDVPDQGFLLAEWAERLGVLEAHEGELRAGPLPEVWNHGVWAALEAVVPELFRLRDWGPIDGYRPQPALGYPFPAAYLLAFISLSYQNTTAWVCPQLLQDWIHEHHPTWARGGARPSQRGPWLATFLLGVAWPLRLVDAARSGEGYRVRLSDFGRAFFCAEALPAPPATFPKMLLVQPNLEVLAYRQGLTPALIRRLTLSATWKTLGAAFTLQLEPETVYRALEAGESFESLARMLEQHGTRPTPPGVLDLLRTWSNKRDRITVYPMATLLEFASARELEDALARGVSGIRASDTLLVVASEEQIDFRHFRLAGTRDYALPPERCVRVEEDGVTLNVDLSRSDLLLETELPRIADLVERHASGVRRIYRLTPESLERAREAGWSLYTLEQWFQQRLGEPASPAAKLLLSAPQLPPPRVERHVVLHLPDEATADGLEQWPVTQGFVVQRLGPTAIVVDETQWTELREVLARLGIDPGELK